MSSRIIKLNRIFDASVMPDNYQVCIYSLMKNGECVYVGQTVTIESRIYQHLLDGKDFDSFEFECCDHLESDKAELETIIKKQPKLNKNLPSNDTYINLANLLPEINDVIRENHHLLPISFSGGKNKKGVCSHFLKHEDADNVKTAIYKSLTLLKIGK